MTKNLNEGTLQVVCNCGKVYFIESNKPKICDECKKKIVSYLVPAPPPNEWAVEQITEIDGKRQKYEYSNALGYRRIIKRYT